MDYRKLISAELAKVLGKGEEEIGKHIEVPKSKELGDFAFPCFMLAKEMRKSPAEIAGEISAKISKPKGIREIRVSGPYLNFFVNEENFAKEIIAKVIDEGRDYGKGSSLKKKKIMVEYSAPNTNKPLHVGHLRNDSTGMAIIRILEANGADVVKADLFSDRGAHICKSMIAYQKWGEGKTPEKEKIKGDQFAGKYYVMFCEEAEKNPDLEKEALEMLAKWEGGDKEVRALWKKMDGWATNGFKETYKNFGSEFDVVFRESDFYGKAKPFIDEGLKKGIFEETENGTIAKLEAYGLPDKTILRKDGTSIYMTADMPLTRHKFEKYKIDEAIWVVGSEQKLYFEQLFKILELLGYDWAKKCRHLSYEMIYLPEGKLKSREGRVVDADELIGKAEKAALDEIEKRYPKLGKKEKEERAKAIGLSAIKFFMLRIDPNKTMLFETEKAVSFEGETGPYVQYSYARAKSILRKAKAEKKIKEIAKKADFGKLNSNEEKELVSLVNNFGAVSEEAARKLAPDKVCQYLIELCLKFNSFYHSHPVIGEEKGLEEARLALVYAVAQTIKNGLHLLNIEVLEEM